jgi:Flp pilus assembly protein TadG
MGLVGAAVDYSRANSDKAAMQAAVDATALMLSKNVSTLTTSQISQEATNYFNALFTRPEVTNVVLTPAYTNNNGSQVVLTATGTVLTKFMKVMGYQSLNINVASTVKWGNVRLRVALVLDNTGSMADNNKIGALKTATNNLLTQLKNAVVNTGDVYVLIVPFVKDVNVDPVNYNALWIEWTDWDANNGTCSKHSYTDKATCLSHLKIWTPANHNTWNGCVVDRGAANAPSALNTDIKVTPPVPGVTDTMLSAEQYGSCPQALMELQLDRHDHAGEQHVARRQHEPGDRPGARLDVAGRRRSVSHTTRHGSALSVPAGDHSSDRWLEHAGSLVQRPGFDRRASADHLQQHQGRGDHAVGRAGRYRRRPDLDAAAELRQRFEQVLPAHVIVADHNDVQPDRHRTIQPARRPIGAAAEACCCRGGSQTRPFVIHVRWELGFLKYRWGKQRLRSQQLGLSHRDGKVVSAMRIAHLDAPSQPLAGAVNFKVESDELGQRKCLFRRRKYPTAVVIFGMVVADQIEKVFVHREPSTHLSPRKLARPF